MSGARQKEEDMGYDSEGGCGAHFLRGSLADKAERDAEARFLAERSKPEADYRPQQVQGQWGETKAGIEGRTCEVICKILRKIHDPNALKVFEKDLALVAVGAETFDRLKREYKQ